MGGDHLSPWATAQTAEGSWGLGFGSGVGENGGQERGTHLPQDPGSKHSPHLWSDRDDLCTSVRRQKTHLWWQFSSSSFRSDWPLGLYNLFVGSPCIYVCHSLKLTHRQVLVSKPVPLFLQVRERGSLTSVSKQCKQRPSWLPVSSKCSLSKKFSGQWLKWHHASSWNPTRDKNQVIQFTTRKFSLLLPAFGGCWLLKRSRKRRACLNSGFENVSWTTST